MIRYVWALALAGAAQADIVLSPPVACRIGVDCYIQQYIDHDPGSGYRDYQCAGLSYDGHKGTDFALRTYAQMRAGVSVIASADGVVRATRDGEPDRLYSGRPRDVPSNRACGNGVVITHDDGWTTQYCHLKRGSIAVKQGQQVTRGTPLGEIGLSGRTQFPHVHLTVRKDNLVVDPFDPDGKITCGRPSETTLWDRDLPYQPGGMINAGFADRVPEFADVKSGDAAQNRLPPDADALVVYGYAFGGRKGDVMRLSIDGPRGEVIAQDVQLDRNQAVLFRAIGKRRTTSSWPKGRYEGRATLIRDGRHISSERTQVDIR